MIISICEKAIPAARRARFAAFRGPFARLAFHRVFRRSKRSQGARAVRQPHHMFGGLWGFPYTQPPSLSLSAPRSVFIISLHSDIASRCFCFTVLLVCHHPLPITDSQSFMVDGFVCTPEFVVRDPPGEPGILAKTMVGYNDFGLTNKTFVKKISGALRAPNSVKNRGGEVYNDFGLTNKHS